MQLDLVGVLTAYAKWLLNSNIPSSLIVAESRLVLTYPAEQLVKKECKPAKT